MAITSLEAFLASLEADSPPATIGPHLQALWLARRGDWDGAHRIVQELDDSAAARIHAWLHRVEGDRWNSEYWHRRAGTTFPDHLSEEAEWEMLVELLIDRSDS